MVVEDEFEVREELEFDMLLAVKLAETEVPFEAPVLAEGDEDALRWESDDVPLPDEGDEEES